MSDQEQILHDAIPGIDLAELHHLLVESVQDYAIFAIGPTGIVLSWNAGAERLKGYAAEEIIGRSFTTFYEPELVAKKFPQHELTVAEREGRFEDEGWRLRKDGSRFWANVVITALRDGHGRLVGFAKVTRDLTARIAAEEERALRIAEEAAAKAEAKRLAAESELLSQQAVELEMQATELQERNEELQTLSEQQARTNVRLEEAVARAEAARAQADQAATATAEAYRELDQFAYVASHDLKAPLRGIANLAQWIQDDAGEQLESESRQHMRMLQGRVHRMEALIDGILAYSRAGRRLGEPEQVDTGGLLREVIELLAPGPEVTIDVPTAMPMVHAERVPLQQVFLNLVGNAVKYSRAMRSDVKIRIGWRDAGDAFEFLVNDNGPGIAPEYQERIWGIFQTLEARDKVEGTGIGLSVVRKIVETRGGRAWLESVPGKGATFRFTWPKTPAEGARE